MQTSSTTDQDKTQTKATDFRVGQRVWFVAGSPAMAVSHIDVERDLVFTEWFTTSGEYKSSHFLPCLLSPYVVRQDSAQWKVPG